MKNTCTKRSSMLVRSKSTLQIGECLLWYLLSTCSVSSYLPEVIISVRAIHILIKVPVLRVAKVGLLNRKDTALDIGKRAKAGKWRLWSVILTSSQLLFFRDHTWATSLQEQMKSMGYRDERILVPPVPLLKPDEVLSLKDSVALFDLSYDRFVSVLSHLFCANHSNWQHDTFLLIAGDRRPFLFQQAPGEEDMNSWVSCINYASAFKTTGVSVRAPGMSGKDVELMGVAAATSHLRDLQCAKRGFSKVSCRALGPKLG